MTCAEAEQAGCKADMFKAFFKERHKKDHIHDRSFTSISKLTFDLLRFVLTAIFFHITSIKAKLHSPVRPLLRDILYS